MQYSVFICAKMSLSFDTVTVYPDELPGDMNDLIDGLRAAFAPLKTWRTAALEYYRQDLHLEFQEVLNYIVDQTETFKEI